jgi:hypothetical protein
MSPWCTESLRFDVDDTLTDHRFKAMRRMSLRLIKLLKKDDSSPINVVALTHFFVVVMCVLEPFFEYLSPTSVQL